MKQLFLLFLLSIPSIAFCQEDQNVIRKNYAYFTSKDSTIEIDLNSKTRHLFSDSTLKIFDTFSNPNYHYLKNRIDPPFQITRDYYSNETEIISEVNESQTLLFYSVGSNNSQVLDIHHLQKISKNIHSQIQLSKNKSDGFYQNQKIKNDRLYADIHLISKNKKHHLIPYFSYIEKKIQENGGIHSDSIFKTGDFNNSLTLETNLSNAFNKWTIYEGGIRQFIKHKNFTLQDNISYRSQERKYTDDPTAIYYDTIYSDTVTTNDKFSLSGFHHSISISQFKKKIRTKVEVESALMEYNNGAIDTSSFQNNIRLNIDYIYNKHSLNAVLFYSISGFNKNNYSANLKYDHLLNSHIERLIGGVQYQFFNNDIKYHMVDMNNYIWNNSFVNSSILSSFVGIKSKYGNLKLLNNLINNYVLLNEYIKPIQVSPIKKMEINYFFEIEKKRSDLNFTARYQKVYEGAEYFKVPDFILQLDYSFKIKLKALETKLGIKGFYLTGFYANSYNPALNDFYLQTSLKTGNYPFFDFYIQSKVKTVELKFMIHHFNSGFTGFNYYTTPLYPMAPRYFQFAFSWFLRD